MYVYISRFCSRSRFSLSVQLVKNHANLFRTHSNNLRSLSLSSHT